MKTLILLICLTGIAVFGRIREERKKPPLYFAPPAILPHLSLGYRDFLANLLWLRFIQNPDFCSFEAGLPVYGSAPPDKDGGALSSHNTIQGEKRCEWGWSYNMVSAVTELAPLFKTPYIFSPVILSIFTGDVKGAEHILLKGLRVFPKDWKINFYSAYLYSVELNKPELAAHFAHESAKNGGPYWLYGFSADQYGMANRVFLGEAVLKALLEKDMPKEQKAHVHRYLQDFRSKYTAKGSAPTTN